MDDAGCIEIRERRRYRHRFCQDGTPLYYQAVVGINRKDIPEAMLS